MAHLPAPFCDQLCNDVAMLDVLFSGLLVVAGVPFCSPEEMKICSTKKVMFLFLLSKQQTSI